MRLIVDFNMTEADGRVPALLMPGRVESVAIGERVVASDGEGTEVVAQVSEISPNGRIAYLVPVGGSWRRDDSFRPSAEDLYAGWK
jgi:hypothetical protein